MDDQRDHLDFSVAVDRLQESSNAYNWPQRRELVRAAVEHLEREGLSESLISLLWLLSDDDKWEVRNDVADCLMRLPDDEFPRFAARLIDDSNRFVKTATKRAMDRRRRGEQNAKKNWRGFDHIREKYDRLEQDYGQEAAELARQMAEQLYSQIVGATVHDMLNILTPLKSGILALANNLCNGAIEPRLFEKGLSKLRNQTEMLEGMIEDMLVYMQPTPIERRQERLADVVDEAHTLVLDNFGDVSKVSITIEIHENLTVDISRRQIVRAISNVLKNAYESFTTDPDTFTRGTICVVGRRVDLERVEIVVSDNGMGLSDDDLAHVRQFIPGGTSKKTHGWGIGLPTAKRTIEDHGGSLAIDSEDGIGTTITITLRIEADGGDL
jgi:signal transduction histidine kinase